MLQEDINNKTIALATNSAKMTTRILLKLIDAFLKHQKGKANGVKHGKQSIKNLAKQGKSMTNIEITNKNIKSFEKYARKYNVDYALKKIHYKDDDGFDKYKHVVFFKAQDTESIKLAFTEYSKDMLERSNSKNTPILDTLENYRDRLEEKVQEPQVVVLPPSKVNEIEEVKEVAPLKDNESKEEKVKEVQEPQPKDNESKEEKTKEVQEPQPKDNESKEEKVKEVEVPQPKANESKEEKVKEVQEPQPKDNESKEDSNKEKLVKDTKKLPTYEAETPEEIAGLMESYNSADFVEYNPYEDEDLLKEFSNNNYDDGIPMSMSNDDEDIDYSSLYNYNEVESSSTTSIKQEKPKENISNKDKNPVKNKSIKEQLESNKKERQVKPKAKVEEIKKPKPKSRGGDAR